MALLTVYASKDATAREGDDGWNGWDNHLPVGQSPAGNRYRSFIYFPLSFTGITNITDAKLWLRATRQAGGVAGLDYHVMGDASGNTRTLAVRRMTSDWGEGTDRGEGVWSNAEFWGWANRASEISTVHIATEVFTGYTHGDWYDIDVTGIVGDWKAGSPNYGVALLIDGGDTVDSKALEFFSRHQGSGFKPYIEITYDTNTAPTAPTSLTPTANALVNTLTPTLTGQRADVDAGDYITAYQIKVFEDDGTTIKWWSSEITQTGTSSIFSRVYSGPALIGNTYYKWQARTRDKGGAWGPFSSLNRFKVNTPPNPPTISISETPSTDIATLTPRINFTHKDNDIGDTKMYGYRLVVYREDGTQMYDSGDVDTSGAPVATKSVVYAGPALGWATSYSYHVKTKDINGVWGTYAEKTFHTHTAVAPIGLNPSLEVSNGLTPDFSGTVQNALDSITSYQIILYANDGVTQIWDSGTLTSGISHGASFVKTYAGTALSYATSYKWKVRITSVNGGTSAYSALQSFTTPAGNTIPVLSITETTAGRVTDLTPTLVGTRTGNLTDYQIEVYPATATSSALGTALWAPSAFTQGAAASFDEVYAGPALTWNTEYKWRARVGAPTLGAWTGLVSFKTDTAGAPTLDAPTDSEWLVQGTESFEGTSYGGENITAFHIGIWNAGITSVVYDSGFVSQAAALTFAHNIDLSTLPAGATYQWAARYKKAGDIVGPWSPYRAFRLNGPPLIPVSMQPTPGQTLGTLFPTFRAEFNDPDETSNEDYPTEWKIEIRNNATDALIHAKTLTTGLNNAVNSYTWGTNTGGTDSGLAYDTVYKWRTAFTDSLGVQGIYSSYQTFNLGEAPTISDLLPSNGSNIATVRPLIQWTYDDPADVPQHHFTIRIIRELNSTVVYQATVTNSSPSFQLPAGYLQHNGEDYTIEVRAWNNNIQGSNFLESSVQLTLDAPPAIEGLSATVYEDQSRIRLSWDASSLGSAFVTYVIYRRDTSDTEWTMIGTRKPETNTSFSDYYAGNGRVYEYRVTVVKIITNEPDIESPDSDIVEAVLDADVWMVIGSDRAEEHIFELPVVDESHNRPVQQEVFEPIGSNRKAVVRGFVLGHEGAVDVTFDSSESMLGKERIEYLLYYAGPHILKNPFGDVFDVTFGSPDYQYVGGGHLNATLSWTEVGGTNNPGLTPDEFLSQIGAL